jgi:hypothetical protein
MGGACSTMRHLRTADKSLFRMSKGKRLCDRPRADGRLILKWTLTEIVCEWCVLDSFGSG